MTHVYAKATLIGTKTPKEIESLLVDTGATFTVHPRNLLEEIGATKVPTAAKLELGDERTVDPDVYAVVMEIEDRKGPTMVVTFTGAKSMLGVRTLEDLGLKFDPVKGSLEGTRPAGVAYYYRHIEPYTTQKHQPNRPPA